MYGTEPAGNLSRRWGLLSEFLNSANGVLATLVLSAVVSASSAYMAIDRGIAPRLGGSSHVAADGPALPPNVQVEMVAAPRPATITTALPAIMSTPEPGQSGPPAAPFMAALPDPAAPDGGMRLAPARIVAGRPPVEPLARPQSIQPATGESVARLRALPGPAPRPFGAAEALVTDAVQTEPTPPAGDAIAESVAQALAGLRPTTRPTAAPQTGDAATTAPEQTAAAPNPTGGLAVSLRPAPRPEAIVALAARSRAAPASQPGSVTVARAEPVDEALTPMRLTAPTTGLGAPRAGANPCNRRLTRGIPRRPGGAPSGSAVVAGLGNGSGPDRDARVVQAALSGNIPAFLRELQPVTFVGSTEAGRRTTVTICVMPDYLAVGSDRDFVRVPLGLPAALRVADGFGMLLPTTRMVDAIYAQADLRLSPQPMTPGAQMSTTDYFVRHNTMVGEQYIRYGGHGGMLVAGHKKDLVLADRLGANPGRVAIYGWHRSQNDPIQPLSTVHGAQYADYSHGIRLVSQTAYVDGEPMDLRRLLVDRTYAGLLNSGGPLSVAAMQIASLR